MRTSRAIRNIAASIIFGAVIILVQLIVQWALARSMGPEYLGLNSLFLATIALLAVAELGFGSAIIYNLYKPLKLKSWGRVSVLMGFYRRVYLMVALIVLGLGLILAPFLHIIVGDNQLNINIYIVFAMFIVNVLLSYLLSYRRSLLQADQQGYVIDIIYTLVLILTSSFQILVLFVIGNYYLFLLGNILLTLVSGVVINKIIARKYPKVDLYERKSLDSKTKKAIFKQVKGLIFHKSASFIVPSSSNVIISVILGLKSVGLASNYLLISNAITSMTWKISGAITASVGNMLVDSDQKKMLSVYRNLQFGASFLAAVSTVTYIVCIGRFVELWVGEEYVLDWSTAVAFASVIYLTVLRIVPNSFKQAAGIFYEDRYVPLIEAGINLVAGVIGVLMFGLQGAFWGMALSTLFLHVYGYPKFVYGAILNRKKLLYLIDLIPSVLAMLLSGMVVFFVEQRIDISGWTGLLLVALVSICITLIVFFVIFRKTVMYEYYEKLIKNNLLTRILRS